MNEESRIKKNENSSPLTHDSSPIKVLLIEDNPGDARLIREALAEAKGISFDLEYADRLQAGLVRLTKGGIDVVLLDLSLPDSRGLDTFVRAYTHAPEIPILVLTGLEDETLALQTLQKSAQDYLIKAHVNSTMLSRVLRYSIERKRAEESLRKNLAQLAKKNRYETIISIITQSVHQSINLQEVLENAVEAMNKNIERVDNVCIYLVEKEEADPTLRRAQDSPQAVLKAHRGYPDWFIERVRRIPYPKGFTWKTIIDGKPRYCADVEQDTVIAPAGRKVGTKSYASMPIRFEGKTIGCININSLEKNAFDEEELKLLEIVAQQIETAISNAQQAEALRESEERYRALVENTHDLIIETSIDGRFLYLSPNHKDDLGYEPSELVGRNIFEHVHPDDRLGVMAVFQRAIKTLSSGHVVFRFRHKNGEWRWFESMGKPFQTVSGEVRGVIISRDITERRRMEAEIIRAQKLESLGILAGGIAHDFNNLLTAILGNISLTKMYSTPEDNMHKRLTEAEKACLRAKDLTQQLLTFSRGGAPVKKLTSIRELIRDSASFALMGSNVKCESSIPADLWAVEIDEGQIGQVINNLVINAQQAMPEGGVIKVRAENVVVDTERGIPSEEGRYVKVTVEDTGIGIKEEHLPRIFDPYFTTKQRGNGLGLATAYSIIKNHAGHIGAESKLGIGTKFYIYLPASQEEIPVRGDLNEEPIIGKGKILVMDDDEIVREVAGETLSHIGYEVEFARDGAEAIELYKKAKENNGSFHAVIMDLTIPGGMGGEEAIKRLLEIDPEVRAIVSSGYSDDPVMNEYRKYGFRGVVAKPYKIEGLRKIVQEVMNEK